MKITHLSAECYPIAKVGGLADVVGALPKYQNDLGAESSVIMPFYNNAYTQKNEFEEVYTGTVIVGRQFDFRLLSLKDNSLGYDLYLVDIPELLFTPSVYSDYDTNRFLAFQVAALTWIAQDAQKPDVIHCHDHHTGLIPFMVSHCLAFSGLAHIPTVLTIHNAQYQGWFSQDLITLLPEFPASKFGFLEWDNSINPLAAGIKCAWRVNTVSPSYMEELKLKANGLESLLRNESAKCSGILNGIDAEVWNPETDHYLIQNYPNSRVQSGKKANKAWLCKTFGLDPSRPLFAFIGRLVGEKGADLFPEIFSNVLSSHEISVLLLGSGHSGVEQQLRHLKDWHGGSYNCYIGYNEELSHIIYAGADYLLMPSRVEPCGLNQMYALRYGTIPVVSSVGGLKDTVIDVGDGGFGIRHDYVNVGEVCHAVERGVRLYEDQATFRKIRRKIMKIDHSWNASAQKYIELYESII
ncbi:MAG: glycogen synthase [Flavobacteriaceae bacterium]|nr:glycogen synthase [Flavobacteriaceae bacterium]